MKPRSSSRAADAGLPTEAGQADLFVSYAREDLPFVRRLAELLEPRNLSTWLDVEGLYAGEPFWDEICKAIDAAGAVIFVITSRSVASEHCRRELMYAAARQKRIVPVYHSEVAEGCVPAEIANLQWVLCRDADDVSAAVDKLTSAIKADWVWLRRHGRLLVRGEEWQSAGRDRSLTLRGRELLEAERWRQQVPEGRERPTELHREFIRASQQARTRRASQLIGSAALALIAVGVASGGVVILYIWKLNSEAAGRLRQESETNVDRAMQSSLRARAVCAYIPMRIPPCDAASLNLAAAQYSARQFIASVTTLSRLMDRLAPPERRSNREWTLLADSLWRRSVYRMPLAETVSDDEERTTVFAAAHADFLEALKIFERLPAEAVQRALVVTKARFLIADGEYRRALLELNDVSTGSEEALLLRSLGNVCTGHLQEGKALLDEYRATLPDGAESPQFRRNWPFYTRVMKQCLSATSQPPSY